MENHDSKMETGEVKSEIQNGVSPEDIPGCSRSAENGVESEAGITSRSNGRQSLDVEMGDQAGTSKGEKSNAERKRRKKKKDASKSNLDILITMLTTLCRIACLFSSLLWSDLRQTFCNARNN